MLIGESWMSITDYMSNMKWDQMISLGSTYADR